ncbi:hypothetical protein B0H13DRAFT_2334153 [Mycena leptocephala]|nr:hypothetical protein B0H13DRAFT_2334153 [Mycena leptocephala]
MLAVSRTTARRFLHACLHFRCMLAVYCTPARCFSAARSPIPAHTLAVFHAPAHRLVFPLHLALPLRLMLPLRLVDVHQPALQTDTRAEMEAEAVHTLTVDITNHISVSVPAPTPRCPLHMASAISSERDSHDLLQRQCSPLLIARSIWYLPYPPSGILTKLSQGSASRLIMAPLSYLHPDVFTMYDRDPHPTAIDFICCRFVSPSAAYLHISLAPYRPSPSITVSSDPRLVYVYVYTYAYANVNVLALV